MGEQHRMRKDEKEQRRFYDVERFVKDLQHTGPAQPRPVTARVLESLVQKFDSFRGIWGPLFTIPLAILLPFGLLMLGLYFGALAFYSGFAGVMGLATFMLERKMGAHIQVEEFSFWKQTLLLLPALLAIMAIFAIALFLAGRI